MWGGHPARPLCNLNVEQLIEPILEIINTITEEERQDLILGFSETDSKGYYEEFCAAIIYLLKN